VGCGGVCWQRAAPAPLPPSLHTSPGRCFAIQTCASPPCCPRDRDESTRCEASQEEEKTSSCRRESAALQPEPSQVTSMPGSGLGSNTKQGLDVSASCRPPSPVPSHALSAPRTTLCSSGDAFHALVGGPGHAMCVQGAQEVRDTACRSRAYSAHACLRSCRRDHALRIYGFGSGFGV
jgi:hypothetical protein